MSVEPECEGLTVGDKTAFVPVITFFVRLIHITDDEFCLWVLGAQLPRFSLSVWALVRSEDGRNGTTLRIIADIILLEVGSSRCV